jgi:hypothetical protein
MQVYYRRKSMMSDSHSGIRFQAVFQDEVKNIIFTRGGEDDLATLGSSTRGLELGSDEDEGKFV